MDTRHGSGFDFGFLGEPVYRLFYRLPVWLGLAIPALVFIAILQVGFATLHGAWAFWVAPIVAFAVGMLIFEMALLAWFVKSDRWKLLEITKAKPEFRLMTGRQFEDFVGAMYEREGYRVEYPAKGADGGYDLVLHRGSERVLVQCKQHALTGVAQVRELYGVLGDHKDRAVFVVSGVFTYEAREFAGGKERLSLVDGTNLLTMIEAGQIAGGPRPAVSTGSASSSPGHGGDV